MPWGGRLQQSYTNWKDLLRWLRVPLYELVESCEPSKVFQVPSLVCYKRVKCCGFWFLVFFFFFCLVVCFVLILQFQKEKRRNCREEVSVGGLFFSAKVVSDIRKWNFVCWDAVSSLLECKVKRVAFVKALDLSYWKKCISFRIS